jgi:NAD(P)-dependent dehydrogenase (short-subunit alcohol dehydrogenase family)
MTQKRLQGQTAWISGATSGIGEATARLFAQEGASVAIVGRRKEIAQKTADQINRDAGHALAIACDVADESQVCRSIEQTVQQFGGLHIIINNAGMVDVCSLHEYTDEQWDRVMAVNVKSVFYFSKHALKHLQQNARSYIVNVGSISSFVGQGSTPVYTTSKHAMLGLTRSIALDYAVDGIRCNCLCPGITDTPMLREHIDTTPDPDATLADRLRRVPMGVSLTPDDVVKSVLYFACEDSTGVTGTSLVIDCGYLTAAEWQHPGHTRFMESP